MPTSRAPRDGAPSQRWSTFVRNHASAVLACDFFVVVTATFWIVDVFVVLEVGSRRIRHWDVTAHPTAEWTGQQFRMVSSGEEPHRFLIHDNDSIYSDRVDCTIAAMGLTILKTPVRSPQANAFCERVIGTIRRECLDWMIPCNEDHQRRILRRGSRITIAGVLTAASDRAFRMRPASGRCRPAIAFVTGTVSLPRRFSGVFITNTGSNQGCLSMLDWRRDYLRSTGL